MVRQIGILAALVFAMACSVSVSLTAKSSTGSDAGALDAGEEASLFVGGPRPISLAIHRQRLTALESATALDLYEHLGPSAKAWMRQRRCRARRKVQELS